MSDGGEPKPLGLLWHLPASQPATLVEGVPQRWASHCFTGLMSEQAAVLATVEDVHRFGGTLWTVALLDVHSLLPLGSGVLPLAWDRRVTMISLQRSSHHSEWWLLIETDGSHDHNPQLDVVRLLVSNTAAALRAGSAVGAEATVQVLPYRSISLRGYDGHRKPDWFSFNQHRWDVIGCTVTRRRAEDFGRLGAARGARLDVYLLDLTGSRGLDTDGLWLGPVVFPGRSVVHGLEATGWSPDEATGLEPTLISPILDLRGLWGDDDDRQQPSAIIQAIPGNRSQTVSLAVWDGGEQTQELRGTPASAVLRGLLTSTEPTPLEFKPHPDGFGVNTELDPLGCVANWRFVVVVDAVGVHVLDFLPRQRKAAADCGAGRVTPH